MIDALVEDRHVPTVWLLLRLGCVFARRGRFSVEWLALVVAVVLRIRAA